MSTLCQIKIATLYIKIWKKSIGYVSISPISNNITKCSIRIYCDNLTIFYKTHNS